MNKPNLLVVCPPDHYVLRNLNEIRELAHMYVGNDVASLREKAPEADIALYSSFIGKSIPFDQIWPYLKKVRWIHSLSAGVEKLLTPEVVESPVIVTNARGVFKRPL